MNALRRVRPRASRRRSCRGSHPRFPRAGVRGMGEEVAVLVHGARWTACRATAPPAPFRGPARRRPRPAPAFASAPDEIVEQRAPGRLLCAHALIASSLLASAHAEPTSSEIEVAFCEPNARDRPVEDQPHDRLFGERARIPGVPIALRLAPDAADHVLADRPGNTRSTRVARGGYWSLRDSPGDQGVGGPGAALVGAQRPLRHSRVLRPRRSPRARHGDPRLAKRARQRRSRCPWRTPTTDGVASSSPACAGRSADATMPRKFRFQHRLNEPAHPSPDPVLDPVEPIIEKQTLGGDSRLLRGILCHGVVSVPARQRRNYLG